MRRLLVIAIVLVVCFSLGPIWPRRTAGGGGGPTWDFDEGFEDTPGTACDNDATDENSWSERTSGSTFDCDDTTQASTGSESMSVNSAGGSGQYETTFTGTSGSFCIEFDVFWETDVLADHNEFGNSWIQIWDSPGFSASWLLQPAAGDEMDFACPGGNTTAATSGLSEDTWHTFKMEGTLSDGTGELWFTMFQSAPATVRIPSPRPT